jgi:hypothetical protein
MIVIGKKKESTIDKMEDMVSNFTTHKFFGL